MIVSRGPRAFALPLAVLTSTSLAFFVEMPHSAISTVFQGLGCQHSLLPSSDYFAAPSIPALTVKGFVRWQAIQTLLEPQTQVPVLQFAAANWGLKHPDTGIPFPVDLPKEAFPSECDPDTDRWHQERAELARMKAAEASEAEAPKSEAPKPEPKPEFTERKVPYSHIRVTPTTPRDYFSSRPINVAYVHVPSPRPAPAGRSPERERARERERDHYFRRQATSSSDDPPNIRRRSFSDYPHSPHEARPSPRVPHPVPERSPHPQRRHSSQPRHYSSTSDSEGAPISPRTPTASARRPPPITVRRVFATTDSPDLDGAGPRIIRTTSTASGMGPPPIPTSRSAHSPSHPVRTHSPRANSDGGRGTASSRDSDPKRRSTLFDLKEKISSFINPVVGGGIGGLNSGAGGGAGLRSASGSRGRREGPGGGSRRGSRDDVLPGPSRLSRSWSDLETDDTDSEEEERRRRRGARRRSSSRERRDRERDRERERERDRDRERALRDRDRDRDRARDRDQGRHRDRPHSDRDEDSRRRDRIPDRPAALAAAASLHRQHRRAGSDDDLSPRGSRWGQQQQQQRGPYLVSADGSHRRTSSHADIDRHRGPREWDRERDGREKERLVREREAQRERELDRELRARDREDRERWRRDRDRDRDRERERMPSPAVSGVTVTSGVGGRKYPDLSWPRD